jgi:hypothetical protein
VQTRLATCRCGQLRAECTGDPVRVSVCHCLDCQKRSGSVFAAQARWPERQVSIAGTASQWSSVGGSGDRATFHFCSVCGATIAYRNAGMPGLVAIPVGAFADPHFPPPHYSVYESRKHAWLTITADSIEHFE